VKARAEGLGFSCDVGFAERGERLLIVLVAAGLYGLGVPYLLPAALWFLVGATLLTVVQRVVHVHRQQGRRARGGDGSVGPANSLGVRASASSSPAPVAASPVANGTA